MDSQEEEDSDQYASAEEEDRKNEMQRFNVQIQENNQRIKNLLLDYNAKKEQLEKIEEW